MNHTIYFRKKVWERFKDEEDKSDLVNSLLEEFYEESKPSVTTQHKAIDKKDSVVLQERPELVKRQTERSVGLCPNGHAIPEGRSKCMGKGCKYAG